MDVNYRVSHLDHWLEEGYGYRAEECKYTQAVHAIADMMHMADLYGYCFPDIMRCAHMHHAAEMQDESVGLPNHVEIWRR